MYAPLSPGHGPSPVMDLREHWCPPTSLWHSLLLYSFLSSRSCPESKWLSLTATLSSTRHLTPLSTWPPHSLGGDPPMWSPPASLFSTSTYLGLVCVSTSPEQSYFTSLSFLTDGKWDLGKQTFNMRTECFKICRGFSLGGISQLFVFSVIILYEGVSFQHDLYLHFLKLNKTKHYKSLFPFFLHWIYCKEHRGIELYHWKKTPRSWNPIPLL